MKVFVFDLLAYGEQLEHLKIDNELPYPLSNQCFRPEVAAPLAQMKSRMACWRSVSGRFEMLRPVM